MDTSEFRYQIKNDFKSSNGFYLDENLSNNI